MIFWTTVLTFIIGIMITMLFPRSDRINVQELPISEAYVASFVAQHQMARDYSEIISFTLPYITPIIGDGNPSGDARYVHVFKDEFDAPDTGFMPDIMPFAAAKKTFPTEDFTSAIICLDAVDKKVTSTITDGETEQTTETPVYGNVVSCKTQAQTFKYTLTYGLLFPQNQYQHNLFKTRLDTDKNTQNTALQKNMFVWEKALANRTKGDPDCGFITLSSDNKAAFISSADGEKRKIPFNIYQTYKSYIEANDIYQPVFCITPIHDPYVTEGLIVHLDSLMNGKNNTGAPIHQELKGNGWLNVVNQNSINFTGSSETTSWNPDDDMALALQNDNDIQIPISSGSQNLLGAEFSLSFIVQFNKYVTESTTGKRPLFGAKNKTYPYVSAMYENGILTVTVFKAPNVVLGKLNASIPYNISAISYVIAPNFHHLFVNGKLEASQVFSGGQIFTGLTDPTLTIGSSGNDTTSKLNADLFNVKVYNRALNQDEIDKNLKTDRKRFKF